MIPPIDPWVWVLIVLTLQPLILLVWAYMLYKAAVSLTAAKISATVDGRVDNAVKQLKGAE